MSPRIPPWLLSALIVCGAAATTAFLRDAFRMYRESDIQYTDWWLPDPQRSHVAWPDWITTNDCRLPEAFLTVKEQRDLVTINKIPTPVLKTWCTRGEGIDKLKIHMQKELGDYEGLAGWHVGVRFRVIFLKSLGELMFNTHIVSRGPPLLCTMDTPLGPRHKISTYDMMTVGYETERGGMATMTVRGREACLLMDLIHA